MMRSAIFFLMTTLLVSCQIRDKNKQQIETVIMQEKSKSTTVELEYTAFDFQQILDGEVAEHRFYFKNTGAFPLIISNVTASCGCTVVEKPEKPVMPGESSYIKAKFDSKGRVGKMYKTITVVSNTDPEFPKLVIKGNVLPAEETKEN